jgi:DNA-binding CsgD family transcriptional regulator
MAVIDQLTDLLGSLHRAEDLPVVERRYLEAAPRLLPGTAFGIYVFRPETSTVEEFAATGVSDFFLARYEEHGREQDPLLRGVMANAVPMDSGALMTAAEWRGSAIYQTIYQLHGFGQALQAPILVDGEIAGTLNFGDQNPGAFSPDHIELASALGRVVGLALSAVRDQQVMSRERDCARIALELADQPVIVSDLRTGLRHANSAARRLQDTLSTPSDPAWFEDLLASGRSSGHTSFASIELADVRGRRVTVQVRTVAPVADPALLVSYLRLVSVDAAPAASCVTALTPREREVAELVAAGLRDAEIATQIYLSPFTVKGHLKSVYRKLGVASRVELTRLLLSREDPGEDQGSWTSLS